MEKELELEKIDKRFLRRWINPYLEKIFSIPDRLIDDSDKNLANVLSERSSEFKETFIEPCSGSGAHLIELARSYPESFFIGFEKRYKRAFRTAEKSEGLKNILIIRGEVDLSLFKDSSIAGVYLNFPDPWEKNQKNRVLNKIFVDELSRILAPNGFFSYKTDHKDSFEAAKIALRERFFITNVIEGASKEESGFQTEFEGLFRSKNLPIFVLRVKQNRSN